MVALGVLVMIVGVDSVRGESSAVEEVGGGWGRSSVVGVPGAEKPTTPSALLLFPGADLLLPTLIPNLPNPIPPKGPEVLVGGVFKAIVADGAGGGPPLLGPKRPIASGGMKAFSAG